MIQNGLLFMASLWLLGFVVSMCATDDLGATPIVKLTAYLASSQ